MKTADPKASKDSFDIARFALPNCNPGEIWFEESRDIANVTATFDGRAPSELEVWYLRKRWPEDRLDKKKDFDFSNPCRMGWSKIDDWFNGQWQKASITVSRIRPNTLSATFRGLASEIADSSDYDVGFRRTMAIRLVVPEQSRARRTRVYTVSGKIRSRLRVQLDAGRRTLGKQIGFTSYNANLTKITPLQGVAAEKKVVLLKKSARRCFELHVTHMLPAHRYSNDDGHIGFVMDDDRFTVSLASLASEGPVWFAEKGIFITDAEDSTSYAEYKQNAAKLKTIHTMVLEQPEQSFVGAYNGQPRPHAVRYNLGVKHAWQRFFLEPNGDIVLSHRHYKGIKGRDTGRFKNGSRAPKKPCCEARFFFGLESWHMIARYPDPAPILAYNFHARQNSIDVRQKSFAVPLFEPAGRDEFPGDQTIICLVRFRFKNTGARRTRAAFTVHYSQDSGRTQNPYRSAGANDALVPDSKMDKLQAANGRITGRWHSEQVLRCLCRTSMKTSIRGNCILFAEYLDPGEHAEAMLKVPFIALESSEELKALEQLDFDLCREKMAEFWRNEQAKGSQLSVPEPHLNELYAAHLAHVQITDFVMPDGSGLINTSVGTSTYGNFCNESCMIIHDLDQRGLHEEARRRLEIWIKYQGTAPQPGNFTDFDGMYFGAGGFESGNYNQHHGWVLWCLCEHFFLTGDEKWFGRIADSLIDGAEWVFRQRRNTMKQLPHSRGWEKGLLPAGSLEDVTDFYYWLSTNCLTWRGVAHAARALAKIDHPRAARIRREANAYRKDLTRCFETMRQHSPLVRLRNGRWVPHYPSRLYRRGRDVGWIREVLEGSVYLLISGFFSANSRPAEWILNDFQDNRYVKSPYGYQIHDFEQNWFDRAGFSIQPLLLAGLMPYLERDEPQIFNWMFFNACCAVYREEIGAITEHPMPVLGYSNSAQFKTSDQANATTWLRYMFVYWNHKLLHLGRAVPRAWFGDGNTLGVTKVATYFGRVDVRFKSKVAEGKIILEAKIARPHEAETIIARFRHPDGNPIKRVLVNGKRWGRFDAAKGDVDISDSVGKIIIEASY